MEWSVEVISNNKKVHHETVNNVLFIMYELVEYVTSHVLDTIILFFLKSHNFSVFISMF